MAGTRKVNKKKQIQGEPILILPVRHMVIFPNVIFPLSMEDPELIELINEALINRSDVGVFTEMERPDKPYQVYKIGTRASILKMFHLPDGSIRFLIQGSERIRIKKLVQKSPFMVAEVEQVPLKVENTLACEARVRTIRSLLKTLTSQSQAIPQDYYQTISSQRNMAKFADSLASNLEISTREQLKLLDFPSLDKRLEMLLEILNREQKILEISDEIQRRVNSQVNKSQREFILREQMRAIREELGEDEEDEEEDWEAEIEGLRKQIKKSGMPDEVEEVALKELERLEEMSPIAAEYTITRTYVDWLLSLPWSVETPDNMDLDNAKKILDEDHYGLNDVKDRILEFLAIRKLRKQSKGPILCFAGPPGVGKTSLGRSIARAMGRKFVRFSVGGIRDEAEIRGHRRTYIGALPGRIIQMIKEAGTSNPVFMLDEIDKIGSDFRGDPSSALLEALDPQQNRDFVDHYLDVKFDLSRVMFITTCNVLYNIPPALLDRMEVIELPGYITEEKVQIAKQYLIPRQIDENGLKKSQIKFKTGSINHIISEYTDEAGVRNLERELARICRKVARRVAEGQKETTTIAIPDAVEFLGPPRTFQEIAGIKDEIGIATGLAWTQAGGEILFIESTAMNGGKNLMLTGQLGEVMRESAQAALSYIRSHAERYQIDPEFFQKHDVHIHIPSGSVPKDGPSAGATIATSLLSLLSHKPVRFDVAMTGEISLRGRVLPVGGIKEKVLAARRAGINTVILPQKNEKDLLEVPDKIRSRMKFIFVEKLNEVFEHAIRNSQSREKDNRVPKKRRNDREDTEKS
ncbi:MAG: endopeptidase La [Calditrichaeota bacterium]|nr:endopeptidase La [Calditrichota bacterium]RQW07222.1 MAG: endopeptidase La [Calditrichota bacterium]